MAGTDAGVTASIVMHKTGSKIVRSVHTVRKGLSLALKAEQYSTFNGKDKESMPRFMSFPLRHFYGIPVW